MFKSFVLLAALCVAALAMPIADDHEDHPEVIAITETPAEAFVRSDADEDLTLTFDEFLHTDTSYVQMKKAEFDMLDTNGKLTAALLNRI